MPDAGTSRILTLVFADLADSTALKTQRGDQAVGGLITRHREHVQRLAAGGGRIIDWAGDGCFLTFETSSAAVLFSLRLQQAHRTEPDLPGVRIGLHLGEVSERSGPEGDIAHPRVEGLAVDLAARICGLARPTQILMSAAVAASAQQRLDGGAFGQPVQWRAHGCYTLKGVAAATEIHEVGFEGVSPLEAPVASEKARPAQAPPSTTLRLSRPAVIVIITLVGLLSAGLGWWRMTSQPNRPPPPAPPQAEALLLTTPVSPPTRKSVAVLPFVNMSSDKENEYFSDGITEDLITALSKISGLHVAARTSSFAFKGKNEAIEKIGEQLHVGAVLEGSVAKAGNQVRITAQLINTADGYHLWSEHYDRDLKDIFAIRSEVAQTVAKALQVTLATGERAIIERKPTEDLEAYQLYLKGRQAAATLNDFTTAVRYLQQAIARDPSYALAYNGLAYYYWSVGDVWMSGSEAWPRMREAADKALELDPSLAEAHVWLGDVYYFYERDYAAAAREFQAAIAMQPELASAHEHYGWYLVGTGEFDQSIAESRRAVELDPLSAEANCVLGSVLYFARRYDEAIVQLHTVLKIDPDYFWAHEFLGRAYAHVGRFAEAIVALETARDLEAPTGAQTESSLARVVADGGDKPAARKILAHIRERMRERFLSDAYVANVLIGLGEIDEAMAALTRAEAQHSYYIGWWKVDPELDPVRADPRFIALMKKVGLNQEQFTDIGNR